MLYAERNLKYRHIYPSKKLNRNELKSSLSVPHKLKLFTARYFKIKGQPAWIKERLSKMCLNSWTQLKRTVEKHLKKKNKKNTWRFYVDSIWCFFFIYILLCFLYLIVFQYWNRIGVLSLCCIFSSMFHLWYFLN